MLEIYMIQLPVPKISLNVWFIEDICVIIDLNLCSKGLVSLVCQCAFNPLPNPM